MTDVIRPRVLSMGMAQQALKDPAFLTALPEFRSLQPKFAMMKDIKTAGCGGCRGRKVVNNFYKDFLYVVCGLSVEGQKRLRKYFGGQPLIVMRQNPKTKRYETVNL